MSRSTTGLPSGHLMMLLAHRAMQRDLERIATTATKLSGTPDVGRIAALARYADRIIQLIEHHHEGEDEFFWPMLRQRGAPKEALDLMLSEHDELHRQLAVVREHLAAVDTDPAAAADRLGGFAAEATRLRETLVAHCVDEERELLDRFAPMLDKAAWGRFERRMARTAPLWTLGFMPPWLASVAGPDELHGVPARPVARLMAGRLRRQQGEVFGY